MDYKSVYKKIERRYIIMGIILILIFISKQLAIQREINLGEDMSAAINVSGRQRMLSQKITKNSLIIYENQNNDVREYYLDDLELSLDRFESSHYNIINGNEKEGISVKNSDTIIGMFEEIEPYFENILESGNQILNLTKGISYDNELILEHTKIIIDNEKIFLEKMDQIVDQYDNEAENNRLKIKKIELFVFYLTILGFVLITIFIFVPATRTLRHAFLHVNESNENIIKLFETMKGALFLVDEDGDIIIKNSDAKEIMILSEGESQSSNIRRSVRWLDINVMDVIKSAISGEKIDSIEVEIENENEQIISLILSAINGRYEKKDIVLINAYDITSQKKAENILKDMAVRDELTGLYNRHFLESIIDREIERARRYDYPISAAILDIDDFKRVNDTWGHPVGDIILQEIAKVLIDHSRGSDYQLRIGGEEFLVLMPHTNLEGAYAVAEKFRKAIEENIHPTVGKYTASFGVAEMKVEENYFELYNRVDNALYKAKRSGKNCVVKSIVGSNRNENDFKDSIEWKKSWESGEKTIDYQHKELFTLLRGLNDKKSELIDKENLVDSLNVLIEKIKEHFAYEEKILEEIGYIHFIEHKRHHAKLLEKTCDLREEFVNGETSYEELVEFVYHDLIVGQLLKQDTKFFKDIKKNKDI